MQNEYWLKTRILEEASDEGDQGSGTLLSGSEPEQEEEPEAGFSPTFDRVLNTDGTFAEGWTSKAFGPGYNGPLSTTKSVADVDKLLRDNMAAARGRQISWPDEKATPEQLAAVRRLTGAPETPDGYGGLRPESIPAEIWDSGGEAKLQAVAHKHHLPPAALKDIVGLYADTLDAAVKANEAEMQEQRTAGLQTLKEEFGREFETKMHAARRFAQTLGLREDNPIFLSPDVVSAMARGAALVSEDRLVGGGTQGLGGTPRTQANAIMTEVTNPLYAKYQSGDPDTVSLVNSLLTQA
jgi:hypothetical protein